MVKRKTKRADRPTRALAGAAEPVRRDWPPGESSFASGSFGLVQYLINVLHMQVMSCSYKDNPTSVVPSPPYNPATSCLLHRRRRR